jgi:hypothetical protein
MNVRPETPGPSLDRGTRIALTLRFVVLIVLAVTLVRAVAAFWDLHEKRGLPLEQVFYIPAVLLGALAVTGVSAWRTLRRFLSAPKDRRAEEETGGDRP